MSNYEVTIIIRDENITSAWLKRLQKVKAELEKTFWRAGNVHEDRLEVEMFEEDFLKQDLIFTYWSETRISVKVGGSDIDRDNLALIEKILKSRANIEIDNGSIWLVFRFYNRDTTYSKFGKFNTRFDIPMNLTIDDKEWRVEIHGYRWKGRSYD